MVVTVRQNSSRPVPITQFPFFSVVQKEANWDVCRLIVEVSRLHTDTHTKPVGPF